MTDRKKIFLPLLIIGAGILLAALVVRAKPDVERVVVTPPAPLIRVTTIEPGAQTFQVRSQGTVQPKTESVLVAQVAGRVEWVSRDFADGGSLRRGETVARIEASDYRLAVAQRDAQVAQAQVLLEREEAEAKLARQEWQELGRGEPSSLTLREPQMAEARASLQAAEASLEQARLNLSRTSVAAPFSGRIRSKRVDLGQYVTPGTPIATIYATDQAEIRLPISKNDLAYLDLDLGQPIAKGTGPKVELVAELGREVQRWPAEIVRVDGEFDSATRMIHLYATVSNPLEADPALPMGLFVDALIEGLAVDSVVTLPRSAIRGESQVLIVDAEDRLRFRDVDIVRLESDRAVIGSGLAPGDRVCTSPLESVTDGMHVRTEEEAAS